MNRRALSNLIVVGCFVGMACVDLSAPHGPASISTLQLPATFVVRGDVMRDSAGNPATPSIIAYDQSGAVVPETGATFFITDSIPRAHLVQGVVFGDSLGTAHILGQVGNLQTPVYALPVTVAPTTIASLLTTRDTLKATPGKDSASSQGTFDVQTKVTGGPQADTAVQGVQVKFAIAYAPPSRASSPTAFLVESNSNTISGLDTTAADGGASRRIVLIADFIADPAVISGTRPDSVVVVASASYRGKPLANSPLRIVVPVKVGF